MMQSDAQVTSFKILSQIPSVTNDAALTWPEYLSFHLIVAKSQHKQKCIPHHLKVNESVFGSMAYLIHTHTNLQSICLLDYN